MDFIKKHGSMISNVCVVLIVLIAMYIKSQEDGADSIFRFEDIYLLVGGMLGVLVLRFAMGERNSKDSSKGKGKNRE